MFTPTGAGDVDFALSGSEFCASEAAGIRNIEMALGSYEKNPSDIELKNRDVARKSIVAKTNISKGEVFSTDNITTKRPGTGLNPMLWNSVIGLRAVRDFLEDELIEL